MTKIIKNGAAAILAIGSTMVANNLPEVSQHAEIAETFNERATE